MVTVPTHVLALAVAGALLAAALAVRIAFRRGARAARRHSEQTHDRLRLSLGADRNDQLREPLLPGQRLPMDEAIAEVDRLTRPPGDDPA